MQAGVKWLSEQTRRGHLQFRNKKGRGVGQGGAMLCATLALIIFGSIFGLHVMDSTIDRSEHAASSSNWEQTIPVAAGGSNQRLRSNKMLLTGANSMTDLPGTVAAAAHNSYSNGLAQPRRGSAQTKANPVGLWQREQQPNVTTSQLATVGKLSGIEDVTELKDLTGRQRARDTDSSYSEDPGVGTQPNLSAELRASDSTSGRQDVRQGVGTQVVAERRAATGNPLDRSSRLQDSLAIRNVSSLLYNDNGAAWQGVSLPLTSTSRSEENPLQGVTRPSLGSTQVSPLPNTKLTTKLPAGTGSGATTTSQLGLVTTQPVNSVTAARQQAATALATARLANPGAVEQSPAARRRTALPGLELDTSTSVRSSSPASRSGAGTAGTAGTARTASTAGTAGSTGFTGTAGTAGTAGLSGLEGRTGTAGYSPATVSEEAEALALAARDSGNLALEPLVTARDANAYKAAEASTVRQPAQPGVATSERSANDLVQGSKGEAASRSDQSPSASTATTSEVMADVMLGGANSHREGISTAADLAGSSSRDRQQESGSLAAEHRALEPLVASEGASMAHRAAEASLQGEQQLPEMDRSPGTMASLMAAAQNSSAETDAMTLPLDWDWKTYLKLNPDVAHEMGNNQEAADVHFMVHGRKEQRPYKLPVSGEVQELASGTTDITLGQSLPQGQSADSTTESAANTAGAALI